MLRVRLANPFGSEPVMVGAAHVAIQSQGAAVEPGSDRVLTFSGLPSFLIPPGGTIISDAVALNVPGLRNLAISIYFPKNTYVTSIYGGPQRGYVAQGNVTSAPDMPESPPTRAGAFLTAVDVAVSAETPAVIAIGDSITEGAASTAGANHRWTDILAKRLAASKMNIAVLNAGIGGNRILQDGASANVPTYGPNALARFSRDVLAQPGAKYTIVLLGINDIGFPGAFTAETDLVPAEAIIAGLRQLIDQAHVHGLKVIGGTLTPFERDVAGNSGGRSGPGNQTATGRGFAYYTAEKGAIRDAVNDWIRKPGSFDGVIDFDKALQDPAHPKRLLPAYDSGDHLHPNDAGYEAMGNAINLALFK